MSEIGSRNRSPLNLDQLVARVRDEARRTTAAYTGSEDSGLSGTKPGLAPEPDFLFGSFSENPPNGLRDFLVMPRNHFLTWAYRVILRRPPDDADLQACAALLRNGASRTFLLARIAWSEEGRQYPVHIRGLRWTGLFRRVRGKRLLKPVLGLLEALTRALSPGLEAEAQVNALRDELEYAHRALLRSMRDRDSYVLQIKSQCDRLARSNAEMRRQIGMLREKIEPIVANAEVPSSPIGDFDSQIQVLERPTQDVGPEARSSDSLTSNKGSFGAAAIGQQDRISAYYVAFEDAFRGEEEEIKASFSHYLADIENAGCVDQHRPLLDLGCGRGEWLLLLREHLVVAAGADINSVMVNRCREHGLDVRQIDAITYLRQQDDASVGAVSAFHVIEHLPFSALYALLEQAHRVLRPGGLLLLETPNPENLLVGSHTFYHDPTHRNPMTPTATAFLVRYFGFAEPEIRRLHPYPPEAKIPGNDPLTERLNGHLRGPQDFAIITRKPGAAA